jgi:hypothetical protein
MYLKPWEKKKKTKNKYFEVLLLFPDRQHTSPFEEGGGEG